MVWRRFGVTVAVAVEAGPRTQAVHLEAVALGDAAAPRRKRREAVTSLKYQSDA